MPELRQIASDAGARTEAGEVGEAVTATEASGAEINAEASSNAAIQAAEFSVEPLPAEQLAAESDRLMQALNPTNANIHFEDNTVAAAKARIVDELGARLEGNQDFMAVADGLKQLFDAHPDLLDDLRFGSQFGAMETPEQVANALLKAWKDGENAAYAALKDAVRDEFNLTDLSRRSTRAVNREARTLFSEYQPGLRAFVRAMYNNTQDWLREQGITDLAVYRGVGYAKLPKTLDPALLDGAPHVMSIAINSASSFSADSHTALQFAQDLTFGKDDDKEALVQMAMGARIPAELVLSTAQSGFGAMGEYEVVALGGRYDMLAVGADNTAWAKASFEDIRAGVVTNQELTDEQVGALLARPEDAPLAADAGAPFDTLPTAEPTAEPTTLAAESESLPAPREDAPVETAVETGPEVTLTKALEATPYDGPSDAYLQQVAAPATREWRCDTVSARARGCPGHDTGRWAAQVLT
jgi:hypothetical protein